MSAISNIVSPYGDVQATTDALANGTPASKLAYEYCTAFGVQVSLDKSQVTRFEVMSTDGIPMGFLYTGTIRNKDGNTETIYYFTSKNIVQKAKDSSRSSRDTRDSNSIKSLIATLKKNKETPEVKSMYSSFATGVRYAFTNVSNARQPSVSISDKLAIDLIEYVLLDKPLSSEQNTNLKQSYESYKSSMKSYQSSMSNSDRFNQGARIIAIAGNNRDKPYYLVGEASYDGKGGSEGVTFHGDLKRYDSLKDLPEFAVDVAMISAYMQGQLNKDERNEFYLPRRDTYYSDIDVATGYAGDELWVTLPKIAP